MVLIRLIPVFASEHRWYSKDMCWTNAFITYMSNISQVILTIITTWHLNLRVHMKLAIQINFILSEAWDAFDSIHKSYQNIFILRETG